VASKAAGSVKRRRQHAVQAAAANAVTVVTPATRPAVSGVDLPFVVGGAAQPQPRDISEGSVQDGRITFM